MYLSERKKRYSRIITASIIATVLFGILTIAHLWNYPWKKREDTENFTLSQSRWVKAWPISPLIQKEKDIKNIIRRFPKEEVARRFGKELRKVEQVLLPISDSYLIPETLDSFQNAPEVFLQDKANWPAILNQDNINDKKFVIIPSPTGVRLIESHYLTPGQNALFKIPNKKGGKRFSAHLWVTKPTKFVIRAGKYSQTFKFEKKDVHTFLPISMIINDVAAKEVKLHVKYGTSYLLNPKVHQWSSIGFQPILLPESKEKWIPLQSSKTQPEKFSHVLELRARTAEDPAVAEPIALGHNLFIFKLPTVSRQTFTTLENYAHSLFPNLAHFFKYSELGTLKRERQHSFMQDLLQQELSYFEIARWFGYHTLVSSSHNALRIQNPYHPLTRELDFEERWLEAEDEAIWSQTLRIDEGHEEESIWEAIFPSLKKQSALKALDSRHREWMTRLMQKSNGKYENLFKLKANEVFISSNENLQLSENLIYFDDLMQNGQLWRTRLLGYFNLGDDPNKIVGTTVNFWKVATEQLKRANLDFDGTKRLTKLKELDEAIGFIRDSLKARGIAHRSVLSLIWPIRTQEGTQTQTFLLTPGIKSKVHYKFKDPTHYMLHLFTRLGLPEKTIKKVQKQRQRERKLTQRYNLYVFPGAECSPIEWHVKGEHPFTDLKHYAPAVEWEPSRKFLRIYPCAQKKPFTISWTQLYTPKAAPSPSEATAPEKIENYLGGGFKVVAQKVEKGNAYPEIYFGQYQISLAEPIFSLKNIKKRFLSKIFMTPAHHEEAFKSYLKRKYSKENSKKTKVFFWMNGKRHADGS